MVADSRFVSGFGSLLDADSYRYHAVYLTYFAASNGLVSFRNAFFEDVGLTGSQMGLLGALLVAGGLVAQPVWGVLADRFSATRAVLLIGVAVSGLGVLLFPLAAHVAWTFGVLAVATLVVSVFRAPILPVANSMVLSQGVEYGHVRAVGSVAFGVGSLLLGWIVAGFGLDWVFYVYALGMGFVFASVWTLSDPRADISPDLRRDAVQLVTNRGFLLLLLVASLVAGSYSAGDAFLSVYLRDLTGGDATTGLAWLVKTVAEAVVFLALAGADLDNRAVLAAGAGATAAGYLVLGVTTAVPLAVGIQVLSGAGVALFLFAAVHMTHRYAPTTLAATGQALLTSAGMGLGRIVGQLGSGWAVSAAGVRALYLVLAGTAAIATLASLGFQPRLAAILNLR
ncbi:MFS transporter [Halapricum desulfuricans]|uniref:MFS family permease n=1 Tax=Halapricum desulfuricans TaxID=2841257 RepID=A0A897MY84_9EURY|nr:MFS transporter [Halapricum desulfuricans]QSG07060.1 MFS family permease [Halapricum desulfuricans]